MLGRNGIVLAIAVVIGLIAVFVANSYFSGVQNQRESVQREQELVRIVVAAQPLEFGTVLTEQNVRLQAWPKSSIPLGAFMTLPEAMKDQRVALRPMVPGEPVLASKVSGTDGRATLAALLPDGMRAVSVAISAVSGVSGFVLPGTMVDVVLTRKIPGEGTTSEDYRSDVVLENVPVLAIDQLANDKQADPKVGRTATLQVSLYDAQRLIMAGKIGDLSLVLRKVETPAGAGALATSVSSGARTITNRDLGGMRMIVRRTGNSGGGNAMAAAYATRGMGFIPPVATGGGQPAVALPGGKSMTVIRGTEPSVYPVGQQVGWQK